MMFFSKKNNENHGSLIMNKIFQKMYEFSEKDNAYIIKLSLNSYLDMFNRIDNNPISKKDLNQSVVSYIEDCSEDISLDKNIILDIRIKKDIYSSDLETRARHGLMNYFEYMQEYHKMIMKKKVRTSLLFIILFIILATLSYSIDSFAINSFSIDSKSIMFRTFKQGISIGSWVFLWEAIVGMTIKYKPSRIFYLFYKRLKNAKVIFHNASHYPRLSQNRNLSLPFNRQIRKR